jgi:CRP-like cAMP-binding protein
MSQNRVDQLLNLEELGVEDRERLGAIPLRRRRFDAEEALQFQDDKAPALFIVDQGWAAAVRELSDGSAQILDLFLPGQIIGLREVASGSTAFSCKALTEMVVHSCPKHELMEQVESSPAISARLFRTIAREEAWVMERIALLGQGDAAQGIAHLMLELADRLALAAGGTTLEEFELPLNQEQIGSVIGVTSVHVSRTLGELKDQGLLEFSDGRVRILDRDRCQTFAEYDRKRMRLDE